MSVGETPGNCDPAEGPVRARALRRAGSLHNRLVIAERPRLLVEACLAAPEVRRASWNCWVELTGFNAIDSVSLDLLPSVAHLNRGSGFREAGRLTGLFRRNWALNQERLGRVLPLLLELRSQGLDPIPIKGVALALSAYGSIGGRCFADADVLVPAAEFGKATDVAARCGFTPRSAFSWPRASVKSVAFYGPYGDEVDLHARPLEEAWDASSEELMRQQPGRVDISGVGFRILSPAASLIVAILHGLRYDRRGYCRWLVDAGLLVQQGSVDWDHVERMGSALRVNLALRAGLRAIAPFLPRGSIPLELDGGGGSPLWERLEHRFRAGSPGGAMGALPNLYFLYRREKRARLWSRGFSSFLREVWSVPPGRSLAPLLARKVLRRASAALLPG